MNLLDWFKRKKAAQPIVHQGATAHAQGLPQDAVLDYVSAVWSGKPADPQFESKSLQEIGINTLHLAELLYQVAQKEAIPIARLTHFLRVGLPGGGDQAVATLVERIEILAKEFDATDRAKLLNAGIVGDRKEIHPISKDFDSVGFSVKMCKAVRSLGELTDHKAIEAEHGIVSVDSGWEPKG